MDSLILDAERMQKTLISYRRHLHSVAEIGFDLKKTQNFLFETLKKIGYSPRFCGGSIVAELGKQDNVLLLRADTDALPMKEETALPFSCKSGNMHACGHDMHATMLLGAATLLKQREHNLPRGIRFLFQAAEETLEGAKSAISAGALKNVTNAVTVHVLTGISLPKGTIVMPSSGIVAPAADYFSIELFGKSAHAATPHLGINALDAMAELAVKLKKEAKNSLLNIGFFQSGTAGNVIPKNALLKGTLRSQNHLKQEQAKERMSALCKNVSEQYAARVNLSFPSGCPPLVVDKRFSNSVFRLFKKHLQKATILSFDQLKKIKKQTGGSEDFSHIAAVVPSAMIALCANESTSRNYPLHHPKTNFDEGVLSLGATLYALCAFLN